MKPLVKSHEVIKAAVDALGVKQVASDLGVSTSLVYKWAEPTDESGTPNPLDRVAALCASTNDDRPVFWLCQARGGVFVKNPDGEAKAVDVLQETQRILKEFSDVLHAVASAFHDHRVSHDEATTIRQEWDELKSVAETFVRACEGFAQKPH